MTAPLPVPIDVAELVVCALRPQLAARPEPVLDGLKVSTRVGDGPNGGPPSLPWLLVAEDGHTLVAPGGHSSGDRAAERAQRGHVPLQRPILAVGVGGSDSARACCERHGGEVARPGRSSRRVVHRHPDRGRRSSSTTHYMAHDRVGTTGSQLCAAWM